MPLRVLSRVFRGIFLARMRAAFIQGKLLGFADARAFDGWERSLRVMEWVVYAKAPFGGPSVVLKYLARYTHRVAISNARLVNFDGGRVTFPDTSGSRADADGDELMTRVDGAEGFVRRWVQHVLPRGFVKVRHYGLLANRHREAKLAACRRLLVAAGYGAAAWTPDPVPVAVCPGCGGDRWVVVERFGPGGPVGAAAPVCRALGRVDSS